MSGPGPGVVLALAGRDLDAPVRVSGKVEILGRRAGDYSMSRTIWRGWGDGCWPRGGDTRQQAREDRETDG